MSAKITKDTKLIVPEAHSGIQINFCKNPNCKNFGRPPLRGEVPRRGRGADNRHIPYGRTGGKSSALTLVCKNCGEYPPIKSNQSVAEEFQRMKSELDLPGPPCCPNPICENSVVPISTPGYYKKNGRTRSGFQRYTCKSCGKTFSGEITPTKRQRIKHKNKRIFELLVNKVPIRRICALEKINPEMFYNRVDFIFRQCRWFSASREKRLVEGKPIPRLYMSSDRQEYHVNWHDQADKRTTILKGMGTADNKSGYVFGLHLDFDPSLDSHAINAEAKSSGDTKLPPAYRRHARVWLDADYRQRQLKQLQRAGQNSVSQNGTNSLEETIQDTYESTVEREDVESPDTPQDSEKLPNRGMQLHSEYTMYGHFMYLRHLLPGVEKLRFFLDQDSGIRAACLGAFPEEVKLRRVDAFYVRTGKKMTVSEKKRLVNETAMRFDNVRDQYPLLSDDEIRALIMRENIRSAQEFGKWNDRWVIYPLRHYE